MTTNKKPQQYTQQEVWIDQEGNFHRAYRDTNGLKGLSIKTIAGFKLSLGQNKQPGNSGVEEESVVTLKP